MTGTNPLDNETLLEADEQPSNGKWIDTCDIVGDATHDEMDAGNDAGTVVKDGFDDAEDDLQPLVARGFMAAAVRTSSDRDRALKKARDLKAVLLKYGVPEVSIELVPGRPHSQGVWDAGFFVGEMSHHTVSRYSKFSLTPVLNLCKRGRPGLGGPLCNGYGGYDLTYRIFTFGLANHPGVGGPITLPALTAGKFTVPKDSARRYVWGTEWEGGLREADWDRELSNPRNGKKMTMREFMGRSNAALEEYLEIHEGAHMEHSTWTSRKIDRLGYTRAEGIAEKNKYKALVNKPKALVNKPKKKPLWSVSVNKVQKEFRSYYGKEGKRKPKNSQSIRRVQKCLGVPITGKVNAATAAAWVHHEKRVGVVHSAKIPNTAPLSVLVKGQYRIKK